MLGRFEPVRPAELGPASTALAVDTARKAFIHRRSHPGYPCDDGSATRQVFDDYVHGRDVMRLIDTAPMTPKKLGCERWLGGPNRLSDDGSLVEMPRQTVLAPFQCTGEQRA